MLLTIPMSWIRHLKYFRSSNAIATFAVFLALGFIMIQTLAGLEEHGFAKDVDLFGSKWQIFAGTVVFSFECINFVLPMYEAHEKKENFICLLTTTLFGVVALFLIFGVTNYLRYGSSTDEIVTKNMPKGTLAASFAFTLSSVLNVPLFLYPASIVIEAKVFSHDGILHDLSAAQRKWSKNALRSLLIVFCAFIAWTGANDVKALLAIIGALTCVPLAFMYPVMCHYKVCRPAFLSRFSDAVICVFGAFLFVATTVKGVRELRQE